MAGNFFHSRFFKSSSVESLEKDWPSYPQSQVLSVNDEEPKLFSILHRHNEEVYSYMNIHLVY